MATLGLRRGISPALLKLIGVLTRFFSLCVVLLALPAVVAAQLTVERVWTQDADGNDKTIFIPGDAIRYMTLIRNTYNEPVKMRIRYMAAGPTWTWGVGGTENPAFRDIYRYIQRDVDVPVGLTGYYSPWIISASAQPGEC